MDARISIENLIEIVKTGGKIKTGIDVYSEKGVLLLDRDVLIEKVKILEIIKGKGIKSVPVNTAMDGGLWDSDGNLIKFSSDGLIEHEKADEHEEMPAPEPKEKAPAGDMTGEIEERLKEIAEIKKQATVKYKEAKQSVKKVLSDIKSTGGQFDYEEVESNVQDLVDFLNMADNPFTYLSQEIFSYDDYLYNHSVNVCAIGTAVASRFNNSFSKIVDNLIHGNSSDLDDPFGDQNPRKKQSFTCFYQEDLSDISLGFFLHDIGKILVPDEILNKKGKLTNVEFEEVRKHSYKYGVEILERNRLKNSVIKNIVQYHHAPLFNKEDRCYPGNKEHADIPLYVRICKLADIYDAMTSKRCYKDAFNPINVVTQLFRTYAGKDRMLQYVLHAFVKSIGIYPPGSIVYLRNGQMAYVLESDGPLVIPFTDKDEKTLAAQPEPFKIIPGLVGDDRQIDGRRSVKEPKEVHDRLPSYIKDVAV